MRKNGFTLIELLAVIVILAIIAVIAVPIVLNIIDESKESATLRSAEMYMDAVEISIANRVMHHGSIADGAYSIMSDGDICLGDYNQTSNPKTCVGKLIDTNNDNILKIEVNGEKPTSGKIYIEKGQIFKEVDTNKKTWLVISEKKIEPVEENGEVKFGIVSSENNKEEEKTLAEVCTYQNNGVAEKTAGAKYTCEVKEGTSYTFYVLTTPQEGDTTINLIMDRNIYYDATAGTGSVADATNKGLVAWQTSGKNADGPVTAMDYLYNATKDWTNIPNIEMNYTDEGNTGVDGYGTIVTTDNITKITKKDGTAVTVLTNQEGYSNLKARLPYKSEVSAYDSTNKTNAYLYDYLSSYNSIQSNPIRGIHGYWTLSSPAGSSNRAWSVYYDGNVYSSRVVDGSSDGVRAVINLKI